MLFRSGRIRAGADEMRPRDGLAFIRHRTGRAVFAAILATILVSCGGPNSRITVASATRSTSQETILPFAARLNKRAIRGMPTWYRVANVVEGDTLNLRSAASPDATVVDTIPRSARGVRATGASSQVGGWAWKEVVYQGRRGWVNSRFLGTDIGYAAPQVVAPGKRLALVVGISSYGGALPGLPNPNPDARAIAATLSSLGFSVDLLTDVDVQTVRDHLSAIVRQSASAETVLFYFAGHGLSVHGESALVALPRQGTTASLQDIDQQLLMLPEVVRLLGASSARSKLVFLDACRDTPEFVALLQRSTNSTIADAAKGLTRVTADRNFLVVYATDPQNVALDGPRDEHSPFASALLARMLEPGVEIHDTLRAVRQDVVGETKGNQSPWVEESLATPFIFAPLPPVTPEYFFGSLISENLNGVIGSEGTTIRSGPTKEVRAELTEQSCGRPLQLTAGVKTPAEVLRWIDGHENDMYGIAESADLKVRFREMGNDPNARVPYLETRCSSSEGDESIWHFDLGGTLLIVDFTREGDGDGWNRFFMTLNH